jgi:thymidylate kinase
VTVTIELVGLCGAGKTTLAGKLAPLLARDTGNVIRPFSRPLPGGTNVLLAAAALASRTLYRCPSEALPLLLNRAGLRLFAKLGYRIAGLAYKSPEPSLISESGVLQPLISFDAQLNYAGLVVPLDAILRQLPQPDLVIRVDLSPEIAFERYRLRERAAGRPVEGSTAMFARALATIDSVCRHHESCGGTVVTFDSLVSDDRSIYALASTLKNFVNKSST